MMGGGYDNYIAYSKKVIEKIQVITEALRY